MIVLFVFSIFQFFGSTSSTVHFFLVWINS